MAGVALGLALLSLILWIVTLPRLLAMHEGLNNVSEAVRALDKMNDLTLDRIRGTEALLKKTIEALGGKP